MTPPDLTLLQQAVKLLEEDQVIAIPTETVYGLAGNIFSEKAVSTIYSLKQRPRTNPLIVHVAALEEAAALVKEIPSPLLALAKKYWPGPLTLLLEKSSVVPDSITAGSRKVAIRVPAHHLTHTLLQKLSFPLVAPSANPYTRISPTTAAHVEYYFGSSIPLILDGGPCKLGLESTIIGFENNKPILYRQGALEKEIIEQTIGEVTIYQNKTTETPTPGLAARHYAPTTPTLLCERNEIVAQLEEQCAVIVFSEAFPELPVEQQFVLSESGSLFEAARNLYSVLHEVDRGGYKKIICEKLPETGLGAVLNDKLKRASSPLNPHQ